MINAPRAADTVPELLRRRYVREPDGTAIVGVDGARLTVGDWYEGAAALASGLVAQGLRPGDQVCLVADGAQWLDFAVSYVATLMAGGVAVPATVAMYDELTTGIREINPALTVVHGNGQVPAAGWPTVPFAELTAPASESGPLPVLAGDMPAEISFTAGTEGRPKPALSYHETLCVTYRSDLFTASTEVGSRYLLALPFGTTFAQTVFLDALQMPNTQLHIAPRFEPGDFVDQLCKLDIDVTFLVPAMVESLMREPRLPWQRATKLGAICVSGAPVRREALAFLAEKVPMASVVNSYCSTEAWPSGTEWEYQPDEPLSVGRPWEGREVRILDSDTGSPVGSGKIGLVCLRSRGVRPRMPLTGAAPVDGWVRTDDLGFLDDDGRLHLVGRHNDIFTVGGILVAPAAIEAALLAHPAVQDAAVVADPHPTLQVIPVALVVPAGPVTSRELLSWCIDRVGEERAPRAIYLVDQIPRSDAGKVVRSATREMLDRARMAARAVDDPDSVVRHLAGIWCELLQPSVRPGPAANFYELGGDSVTAIRLAVRLELDYGVRLPPRAVAENPGLRELGELLVESLRGTRFSGE